VEVEPSCGRLPGSPGTRGFRVLGWESAGEIPSEVEGALQPPRTFPYPYCIREFSQYLASS
jgi:hypothetical protein